MKYLERRPTCLSFLDEEQNIKKTDYKKLHIFFTGFCSSNIVEAMYLSSKYLLFKVSNRNTRNRCGICLKLTIKTSDRCQFTPFTSTFIVEFKYVFVCCIATPLYSTCMVVDQYGRY